MSFQVIQQNKLKTSTHTNGEGDYILFLISYNRKHCTTFVSLIDNDDLRIN